LEHIRINYEMMDFSRAVMEWWSLSDRASAGNQSDQRGKPCWLPFLQEISSFWLYASYFMESLRTQIVRIHIFR